MQISAVPKALKRWKKVYFYLLLMQYQMLFVSKSQVEIQFFFFFSCLYELICSKCISILQNILSNKNHLRQILVKSRHVLFLSVLFEIYVVTVIFIYCLIESIDNGQTWIVFEIYLDVYNVVFSIVCLTLILFNLV